MNANFAFPRPQPAVPRPAPAAKSSSSSSDLAGSRESNALRASILDTALELGIGSNSVVTDWMFNNSVIEETEEEEPVPSPGLTYGSPTSEESVLSPSPSLPHSKYRRDPIVNVNGYGANHNLNQNVNKPGPLIFQRRDTIAVGSGRVSDANSQNANFRVGFNANQTASSVNDFQTITINDSGVAFSDFSIPPRPTTPSGRKLRKRRAGGDGYESDGGYVNETGKKDNKKENSGENKEVKQRLKQETKKKSFIQVINKMSTSNEVPSLTKGYETDGGADTPSSKSKGKIKKSKSKNASNEIGYETDGGYQSSSGLKKSKTRFFKLSTKSSKGDIRVDANGFVPALPNSVENKNESVVPLPIADRFATTLSYTISCPSTMEGGGSHTGSPLPALAFESFAATSDFTSTTSFTSLVSAGSSTFHRTPSTTSGSPSAFNVNAHLKNPGSRRSVISSSSGSGSNQHHEPQKRPSLFSPSHSTPSSMQGHQRGLRAASSLSSLKPPHPVISLPITRTTSPAPAGLRSAPLPPHSRSVSPLTPYVSPTTSVPPLQITKAQRTKPHLDKLSPVTQHLPSGSVSPSSAVGSPHAPLTPIVPLSQTPSSGSGSAVVRPRNPPTDGFGPRSAPATKSGHGSNSGPSPASSPGVSSVGSNSSNNRLVPHPYSQGHSRWTSQQSIIPSSDYIVPSPRHSPLKLHTPGLPSSNMLAAYYHHDYIPPPPSPAPIGPLPTLPSSESVIPTGLSGNSGGSTAQFPSAAQLRQRMTLMRQSVQQDCGIGLSAQRSREYFFPSRPVLSPSQSTVANGSVSVGGSGVETRDGNHQYDLHALGYSAVGPSADDTVEEQEIAEGERRVAAGRQSWIDIDDLDERETVEVEDEEGEEPDELYEILGQFENRSNESGDSSPRGRALERSHSFKAGKFGKEQQHYPDNFGVRPRQNNKIPADVCGFEDDGRTVGDRTSRWSGSVYSRASILDEDESEETRDRFVRRVEAMLDAEKMARSKAQSHDSAQEHIPPLPKMPGNIAHKPNGNAGAHSNITPGRSWNKF